MAKTEKVRAMLLKKGEVAKLLGYTQSSGYRYVDYLVQNEFITPRFLPGVKSARFLRDEVEELLLTIQHEDVPVFEPVEKAQWS